MKNIKVICSSSLAPYIDGPPAYIEGPPAYIGGPPPYIGGPPPYIDGPPPYIGGPPPYIGGPPPYIGGPSPYIGGPPPYIGGQFVQLSYVAGQDDPGSKHSMTLALLTQQETVIPKGHPLPPLGAQGGWGQTGMFELFIDAAVEQLPPDGKHTVPPSALLQLR